MFEESLQMPMLIRYPREIEPGTVNRDIVTNLDFAPTLLDYAGVPTPSAMQGRSFRSNLRGDTPDDWPTAMYYRYWMHMAHHGAPAHYGIRTRRYKLIFFYGLPMDASYVDEPTPPGWELYDTERDPDETHNVYDDPDYQDVVDELMGELARLRQRYGDTDERYPQVAERARATGAPPH
jgi:N-acetylglucosamine-6-sulfatase